jgi:hypothetical protein
MIKDPLPLIYALIDALLLLETSGPEEVNPDVAVRGMENIASSILQMEESDQQMLRVSLRQIGEQSEDEAYKRFVLSLADMIGLAPETR